MNLLDLMEEEEPKAPPKRVCRCPTIYWPTMFVNSHVRDDVITLLEQGNLRKLAELGVRWYHEGERKWYSWTSAHVRWWRANGRPFPRCNGVS